MSAICFRTMKAIGRLVAAMAVLLAVGGTVSASVLYVDLNSSSPSPPFTSWATAARTIQHAVDAAVVGDEIVVTNGIYATGGRPAGTNRLANRVLVDKAVTIRSLNGPEVTVITGGGTNRCAYLASGAVLDGFTLTNGATRSDYYANDSDQRGGGVWCESSSTLVTNCRIVGNKAQLEGGGVWRGTLDSCTVSNNTVSQGVGGGTYQSTLTSCSLIANSARTPPGLPPGGDAAKDAKDYEFLGAGGGAFGGTLENCVLTGNYANSAGGGAYGATLNNCTLSGNGASRGGGASGGSLNNCMVSSNSARYGGGTSSSTLANCTLVGNRAVGYYDPHYQDYYPGNGGGAYDSTLMTCIFTGNWASDHGGGAVGSTMNNCIVRSNSAKYGGGTAGGTLNNCMVSSNSANYGGGTSGATLTNCTLVGNRVVGYVQQYGFEYDYVGGHGGGAYDSMLTGCTSSGNSAEHGGGAYNGTLNNCTVIGNTANWFGGGAASSTLNNCTLTGNSANLGGGAHDTTLNNCIVYYNSAPSGPNYSSSTLSFSCATPLATGARNIDSEPLLASSSHLSDQSPCIGRGNSAYASGVDIDGEGWLNPPCMGADQFVAGQATGGLSMAITAAYTKVSTGFALAFLAHNSGRITASVWDFGDGVVVSNRPYASHAWSAPGIYEVKLTGYNDTWPGGVSATVVVQVGAREVCYVNGSNAAPVYPYMSWATAATTIQEAIDAGTQVGRLVLVADGVYGSGGRAVYGEMTNRVVVAEGVEVRSVNGPATTLIMGLGVGTYGTNSGEGAVRCAYVGANAVLSGFTLTNGHTRTAGDYGRELSGAGVWCEIPGVVSNCTLAGNSASYSGGGAYSGTLNNCTLTGNWATGYDNVVHRYGGGVFFSTLNHCTVSSNLATGYYSSGGGAYLGTLNNCIVSGNSASSGGGAYGGMLNNCSVSSNSASSGGGACLGTLNNCTVINNSADYNGGGAFGGTLNNCTLTGNSADRSGGGASWSTLNNCTLTGNSADSGGGTLGGTLNNCIVYYNSALNDSNYSDSTLNYSCATPLAPGPGNIDSEPMLASSSHLSAQSPCIGRGSGAYTSGVDTDGESWLNPPCMGADQFVAGQATGGLTMTITAAHTNVSMGLALAFVAHNSGRITASVWDFGDGVVVSNRPYASHAWSASGIYEVKLTGYNDTWPGGVSATVAVQVGAREVYYVNGSNAAPVYPYMSWATAATTIQEAIDTGTQVGRLVLVADGVYGSGGRAVYGEMTNRVVVAEGVEVRSVNGPATTLIMGLGVGTYGTNNGEGAVRCAYVGANAVLSGFTLTNGHTQMAGDDDMEQSGAGVWCEISGVVSNCTLAGNSASYSGGGAYSGTLNNCILTGNSAYKAGGGAYGGTLNNCMVSSNLVTGYYSSGGGAHSGTLNCCIVSGNSAHNGGGVFGSTLNRCTLSGNSAHDSGGGAAWSTLNNCFLSRNSARYGGGAHHGTVNNCTVSCNSADRGGGAYGGTLNNCIVYYNSATDGPNYYSSTLNYSCTIPLPSSGLGNITNEPRFISLAVYNLQLQSASPCINAGNNAYALGTTDLDGNPRIAGGTVDMGAYEFQGTPAEWLRRLLAQVSSGWARSKPLVAILSAALRSLERGNCHSAINQLGAFQRQARAQVAAADPALAGAFIGSAQNILDALNGCDGGGSGLSHGRFMSAKRQANGHVRLEISAEAGSIFILEASTNFVDWVPVYTNVMHLPVIEYIDREVTNKPQCFYRITGP